MGEVSRRAFLASGSAGAVAIAGVASGGLGAIGLVAGEEGELTPAEIDAVAAPMMLHVRDAAAGEVEILFEDQSLVVTDKTLVAKVLRATR
ncbi:MAG TPA: hypothetical protein VGZ52_01345 [Acidimicrobiales bacterium]|jgi:hypothetical protein|nr:hypothetical protein [Acidimicrobiales bacterium]